MAQNKVQPPTPLKDRPFFFAIGACAITATATWGALENIRVAPLKEKLELQVAANKSSPSIQDVTLSRINTEKGQVIEQNFRFTDPEGDAIFLSYVLIGSNAKGIRVEASSIDVPAEQQKNGATVVGKWNCGKESYFVKLRAFITDLGGRVSRPYDYAINCN